MNRPARTVSAWSLLLVAVLLFAGMDILEHFRPRDGYAAEAVTVVAGFACIAAGLIILHRAGRKS